MKVNHTNHQHQENEIGVTIWGKPQPLPMGSKLDKIFMAGVMKQIKEGCTLAWNKITNK